MAYITEVIDSKRVIKGGEVSETMDFRRGKGVVAPLTTSLPQYNDLHIYAHKLSRTLMIKIMDGKFL